MRCPTCEGTMKLEVVDEREVGDVFGLTSVLVRRFPLFTCSKCSDVLLPGPAIELMRSKLRETILAQNFALGGAEIRFLRKSVALTQQRLADLLGKDRVTVARWETQPDPVGIPESIAIRAIVRAASNEPDHPAVLRDLPKPRPARFELDAPREVSL